MRFDGAVVLRYASLTEGRRTTNASFALVTGPRFGQDSDLGLIFLGEIALPNTVLKL
jgi:hypothetical protein